MNASAANHTDVVDAANTDPQPGLGADLLAVVARLNRLATQRIQMPLPWAQARVLGTIQSQEDSRSGDAAGDARALRTRITAEGLRTLTAVRADRVAAIQPQLAELEPEERQVLVEA